MAGHTAISRTDSQAEPVKGSPVWLKHTSSFALELSFTQGLCRTTASMAPSLLDSTSSPGVRKYGRRRRLPWYTLLAGSLFVALEGISHLRGTLSPLRETYSSATEYWTGWRDPHLWHVREERYRLVRLQTSRNKRSL